MACLVTQALPDLIPGPLNLPCITSEEYCSQFAEELRRTLQVCVCDSVCVC